MTEPAAALADLGWDAGVEARWATLGAGADVVPARVIRVERGACIVATGDDERLATAAVLPAVGDWAAVEVGEDWAVVRDVVERWSALVRQDPLGDRDQVLAANVDLVLVTAPADRPSPARVEREIVIGWDSGRGRSSSSPRPTSTPGTRTRCATASPAST